MPRTPLVLSFTASLVLGAVLAPIAGVAEPDGEPGPPPSVLAEPQRGEAAIRALGDRLPAVAARQGMTPGEFRQYLRADDQRWVGRSGEVFVQDEMLLAEEAAGGVDSLTDPATFPYGETFQLHSRPGAQRVVYLDFDGHTISGTAWAGGSTVTTRAFDTDGNPATFTTSEMDVVQSVWRRVAEDFAAFDVDVTTEDPGIDAIRRSGSGDQAYGTRLVVADDHMTTMCSGGCGGVAYVGTFDITSSHDHYQPAWVFTEGVGHGAKNIAEAASHEVGHNLGLSHDGAPGTGYYSGHDGWAPIMGVGYSQPITQWSRGEYAGATQTQDDLAVMAANGATPVADDHGDDAGTATALGGTELAATGVISTPGDVDAFTFTAGAGAVQLTVSPAATSPDLDVRIELRSSTGALLASSDPASARVNGDVASGMGASILTSVDAGTYVLLVDGTGRGADPTVGYSDYGSLGAYALTGSVPGGGGDVNQAPTAVVSASTTSGEAPLTVQFDSTGSSDPDGTIVSRDWDLGDGTTASGASVGHTFDTPGSYTVRLTVVDDDGAADTDTVTITVDAPTVQPPAAPDGTSASSTDGTVTVSWTDRSGDETGFEVQREKQHRNGRWNATTLVTTAGPDSTSVTDQPGSGTFRYRVRAVNDGGASAWSDWATVEVTGGGDSGGGGGKGGGNGGGKGNNKP